MSSQLSPLRPLADGEARQALHNEVSAHNLTHRTLQAEIQRRLTAEYAVIIQRDQLIEYSTAYNQSQKMLQKWYLEYSHMQEVAQQAKADLEAITLKLRVCYHLKKTFFTDIKQEMPNLNLIRAKDRQIRILKMKLSNFEGHLNPINEENQHFRDGFIAKDTAEVSRRFSIFQCKMFDSNTLQWTDGGVMIKFEEHNGQLMF